MAPSTHSEPRGSDSWSDEGWGQSWRDASGSGLPAVVTVSSRVRIEERRARAGAGAEGATPRDAATLVRGAAKF
ncbi:hypothetical protein [Methylocella sp.]